MDFSILIAGGILSVTLVGFYVNSLNKFLTIREHVEFKDNVYRELDKHQEAIIRLEDTRPTTGELESYLKASKL
jgi:hypothetical protein